MILLGQIDKCVLVSLPLCNLADLDLGFRLKFSRACICREFPGKRAHLILGLILGTDFTQCP